MKKNTHAKAFTLVEMLVALAVLAVLAALVSNAAFSALDRTKTATCAANIRKLGQGLMLYCQDHDGEFPRSAHSAAANREPGWATSIAPYLGASEENATAAWVNQRFPCPGNANATRGGYSYGLNVFFELKKGDSYLGRPQTWRRTMQVPSPARTILLAEVPSKAALSSAGDHFMSHQWSTTTAANTAVAADRHRGKAHYLFVDGHVDQLPAVETFSSKEKNLWNPSVAGASAEDIAAQLTGL